MMGPARIRNHILIIAQKYGQESEGSFPDQSGIERFAW